MLIPVLFVQASESVVGWGRSSARCHVFAEGGLVRQSGPADFQHAAQSILWMAVRFFGPCSGLWWERARSLMCHDQLLLGVAGFIICLVDAFRWFGVLSAFMGMNC